VYEEGRAGDCRKGDPTVLRETYMSIIYTFTEAGSLAVGVTRPIKDGDQSSSGMTGITGIHCRIMIDTAILICDADL
jgi:hypothetical protein